MIFRTLDIQRIKLHLLRAELLCRLHNDAYTFKQQSIRNRFLAYLRAYRKRGIFPQNIVSFAKTPVFRDSSGTLCAVGHLMHQDGQAGLIESVVEQDNLVRLKDVHCGPVIDWLDSVYLSPKEAAIIQPVYSSCMLDASKCLPVHPAKVLSMNVWNAGVGLLPEVLLLYVCFIFLYFKCFV